MAFDYFVIMEENRGYLENKMVENAEIRVVVFCDHLILNNICLPECITQMLSLIIKNTELSSER